MCLTFHFLPACLPLSIPHSLIFLHFSAFLSPSSEVFLLPIRLLNTDSDPRTVSSTIIEYLPLKFNEWVRLTGNELYKLAIYPNGYSTILVQGDILCATFLTKDPSIRFCNLIKREGFPYAIEIISSVGILPPTKASTSDSSTHVTDDGVNPRKTPLSRKLVLHIINLDRGNPISKINDWANLFPDDLRDLVREKLSEPDILKGIVITGGKIGVHVVFEFPITAGGLLPRRVLGPWIYGWDETLIG